ncbi:hypothetical protein D3C84_997250 [compost metagenome]
MDSNQSIIRSLKFSLCSVFLDKNMALIIGTYVSESINAPAIAKPTVIAIGLNIFPSVPIKARIGK